jgi:hypothetical protein
VPRATEAEVRDLLDVPATEVVTPYLADANIIVTEELGTSSLTADRLKLIEKFLAAHFYILAKEGGGITHERVGESEQRYAAAGLREGFSSTRWGQQATVLDTTGALRRLSAREGYAGFRVV